MAIITQVSNSIGAIGNWTLHRILRVPVFRLALMDDRFSRGLIYAYNICRQRSIRPVVFDAQRAELSLQRFISLGAQEHFVTPRDGKGKIHMITLCAHDLERLIKGLGGSWEKINIAGQDGSKYVLAITPPANHLSNQNWKKFEEKLLKFGWEKRNNLIITCEDADLISEDDYSRYCFLYTHSTSSSFTSDWKRAGFYLGAKQDLCYFNNGNIWKSSGRPSPSEETFYLDIEAVYEQIKGKYPPENMWIGGSCGGAPLAAFLKKNLHKQGINFFVEQSFPNLKDFVEPISPFWFPRVLGCLSSHELSSEMPNRPPSCQFSVESLWQNLEKYEGQGGKFILVEVEKDEHLAPEAYQRYLQIAQRVNKDVTHIRFTSKAAYHHGDDFFLYSESRRTFIQTVFRKDHGDDYLS